MTKQEFGYHCQTTLSGIERGFICNFWNLFQILDFMLKYDNFENRSDVENPLQAEQK